MCSVFIIFGSIRFWYLVAVVLYVNRLTRNTPSTLAFSNRFSFDYFCNPVRTSHSSPRSERKKVESKGEIRESNRISECLPPPFTLAPLPMLPTIPPSYPSKSHQLCESESLCLECIARRDIHFCQEFDSWCQIDSFSARIRAGLLFGTESPVTGTKEILFSITT